MSCIPDPDEQFHIWPYLPTDTSRIPPSAARETKSGRSPYTEVGVYPDAVGNGSEANQTAHFADSLRSFPFGGGFDIGRCMSTRNEVGPLPAPPNEVRATESGSEPPSATVSG